MKNGISKLTLGTAQLGLDYGINFSQGQPSEKESQKILKYAFANGINAIDTSPNYGDSERRIGKFMETIMETIDNNRSIASLSCFLVGQKDIDAFVITKLDAQDFSEKLWKDKKALLQRVENELIESNMNFPLVEISAYLLHFADQAFRDGGVVLDILVKLKRQGFINLIGTSLYTADELERCIDDKRIDVVQLPFSILDRRLLESGLLRKARERGLVIFARSVFLQGLVFMQQLPFGKGFNNAKATMAVSGLNRLAEFCDMSVNELCLRYVLSINEVSSAVIGVDSLKQLKENIRVASLGLLDKDIMKEIERLPQMPAELVDIRSWGQRFDFTGGIR